MAPTTEEAERLALPQLQAMVRLRTGQELLAQELVETAEAARLDPQHSYLLEQMRASWVIGDQAAASSRIRELAARFGVDEVMVHPVAGAVAGTAPGSSPAREQTLRLLAEALT